MFTLQLSVQFVRCTVLRSLGLIFGREGGLATLCNFPLSSWYLCSLRTVWIMFPLFLWPWGDKFKPHLQCWSFKLFKTWEAVSLGSNFSAWISWRVSIITLTYQASAFSFRKMTASGNMGGFHIILEQCSNGLLQREKLWDWGGTSASSSLVREQGQCHFS